MKIPTKFTTKKGREIDIIMPTMKMLKPLLVFVNRLTAEDTFLTFTGPPLTLKAEKKWLKETLQNIKAGKNFLIWAVYDNRIIGSCDLGRGNSREPHVGGLGLMVDKDFREEGIGSFLMENILKKAKEMKLKIVKLYIFDDNIIAKRLYEKHGFKEFARLPNGFYRKGKYTDALQMYKEL